MKSLPRLEDVYDLDDMNCEKHPDKKWPHKVKFPWPMECPGPGVPRKRNP